LETPKIESCGHAACSHATTLGNDYCTQCEALADTAGINRSREVAGRKGKTLDQKYAQPIVGEPQVKSQKQFVNHRGWDSYNYPSLRERPH